MIASSAGAAVLATAVAAVSEVCVVASVEDDKAGTYPLELVPEILRAMLPSIRIQIYQGLQVR